ncbi:hypothetical protein VKT23_017929 [Stygiomarasmius scandens]|uniref:PLP-dependent transferase n=1 Tax=Marasmiellus scandens TaxID=2682957 RepID=A0ABR1IUY8_9AGAR
MSLPPSSSLLPRPLSDFKPWEDLTREEKFYRMGSWFLGNHAENAPILTKCMTSIITNVQSGRKEIWKNDEPMIEEVMSESPAFISSVNYLQGVLESLAKSLSKHSVPFYSPRYAGHMSTDLSLPAVLGYALGQHFNQNNVTPEASALTSYMEYVVGQQLCYILGFKTSSDDVYEDDVIGWGHITADGSIANLESIWHVLIARNLKYYPFSLQLAMRPGEKFEFIGQSFDIKLCNGKTKRFNLCDSWDLLNLSPSTVADIPKRLYDNYGISSDALSDVLRPFSIQTLGMEELNKRFKIEQHAKYMVSIANHYSWPKGCAIAGIGRENLIEIGVDLDIRMDTDKLEKQLESCLENKQAVFCVVAVCGTTEHGAVDPVKRIVELRDKMAEKGLSFMIHGDAAWGGYFASKVLPGLRGPRRKPYAFSINLNKWTNTQLGMLEKVDTITIDPHKSGYIPYPAGALCMRDSRFRFLTTWTSAYINTEGTEDLNMGIYGIEGSKPGAAAVAVLLSHEFLGLQRDDKGGYANLLGTAMLTGIKMYGHWVTMDLLSDSLVVTPLNRLPSEVAGESQEKIREQKRTILNKIVNRDNYELEDDEEAMALMGQIGSDTMINAFVCNFKIDGKVNDDIVQANFLNDRLYERLSVRTIRDVINDKPLIINRTVFKHSAYKNTLEFLKQRMEVKGGPEDIVALSNVSMSPFPTKGQFLKDMMADFRTIAEQEIENCLVRVKERPSVHVFLLQGIQTGSLHLVHLPMFHIKNHQRQLILSVTISDLDIQKVKELEAKSAGVLTVHTSSKTLEGLQDIDTILREKTFIADIRSGFPTIYSASTLDSHAISGVKFMILEKRFDASLHSVPNSYPDAMPFVLYGSGKSFNLHHVITKAPNVQLIAADVILDPGLDVDPKELYLVTLDNYMEWSMQPFSDTQRPVFFKPEKQLCATVYTVDKDLIAEKGILNAINNTGVKKGKLTLPAKSNLYIDYSLLNEAIAADIYITAPEVNKVNSVADFLVKAFKDGTIIWTDNVIDALRKTYPDMSGCSVTLGLPDRLPGPGTPFAIVSRFAPMNKKSQTPDVIYAAQKSE